MKKVSFLVIAFIALAILWHFKFLIIGLILLAIFAIRFKKIAKFFKS